MLSRLTQLGVVLCCCGLLAPITHGATIFVQFFPLTGEVRLQNSSNDSFDFVMYSLTSPSGALNDDPAVWKSITDDYDASGNGFIDPINDWIKLSESPTQLAEGVIPNPGGSLGPYRSVSLGYIWNSAIAPATEITAVVTQADDQLANVAYSYNNLVGNYNNGDLVVNSLDYNVWKTCYGQSANICSFFADGNLDGIVNAADYTVYRNNLGNSLPGAATAVADGGATQSFLVAAVVPEPIAAHLLLIAAPILIAGRRIRRGQHPPRDAAHYCNRSRTAS